MEEAEKTLRNRWQTITNRQNEIQTHRAMLDLEERDLIAEKIELNEKIGEFVIKHTLTEETG